MKSKKSCKYFDACGSAENCARCTGYEKRIPEGTLEQGDEMGRKVKKGDMLDALEGLLDMVTDNRTHGQEVDAACEALVKARGTP